MPQKRYVFSIFPSSGTLDADNTLRHYSYECKANVQDRPYTSRPSRTQQLANPKLTPKLTSDVPNDLLRNQGIADQQLAEAEARRRNGDLPAADLEDHEGRSASARARSRSRSVSSYSSVSTISTDRSRSLSRSPLERSDSRDGAPSGRQATTRNRSRTPDASRKRKHRSVSSSHSPSPRHARRSPGSHRKSRRHRTISPLDRGRPSSMRRGSHRSRSNSPSMDKSQITKHRRSMDTENQRPSGFGRGQNPQGGDDPRWNGKQNRSRKERSLSPYSKRLALTQAMNM